MTTADFRNGMFLKWEGEIYELVYFQHVKPGKGGAFVRTRLKSLRTGNIREVTFRAGESIEPVYFEERRATFLYEQNGLYCFMDQETYEQTEVSENFLGTAKAFLKEGEAYHFIYCDGKLVQIRPPAFMTLEVKDTDPGVKGDTASGGTKPATLETGAVVQVPLFVQIGDKVKVDTRTLTYIERA